MKKFTGKIRWFDESSGFGQIRLNELNASVFFYSCNVKGADSAHPELVSNIQFEKDVDVTFDLYLDDEFMAQIGAVNIEKVA
jgi:cold shock CspA family protein